MGKESHYHIPKHCHNELHESITLKFILMHSLWDNRSQHAQLEKKVHDKTWAYLQSIVKYMLSTERNCLINSQTIKVTAKYLNIYSS